MLDSSISLQKVEKSWWRKDLFVDRMFQLTGLDYDTVFDEGRTGHMNDDQAIETYFLSKMPRSDMHSLHRFLSEDVGLSEVFFNKIQCFDDDYFNQVSFDRALKMISALIVSFCNGKESSHEFWFPNNKDVRIDEFVLSERNTFIFNTLTDFKCIHSSEFIDTLSGKLNPNKNYEFYFHGTSASIAQIISEFGIDVYVGVDKTDFGQSFYLNENFDSALEWATKWFPVDPAVCIFAMETGWLDFDGVQFLRFDEVDAEWKDFVWTCRKTPYLYPRPRAEHYVRGPMWENVRAKKSDMEAKLATNGDIQVAMKKEPLIGLLKDNMTCVLRMTSPEEIQPQAVLNHSLEEFPLLGAST